MTEKVTFHNGIIMPSIGFGTWQLPEKDNVAYDAVSHALKVGYRHIDTAQAYGNEAAVGSAIKDSRLAREEIFVTTKVWNNQRGYDKTKQSIEESLEKLQLDYIDLVLIHWPNPKALRDISPDEWKTANAESWRAMEDLYDAGKIRAIGVSNFMVHHLESLKEQARVQPMVNQILLAPGLLQQEVVDYCKANNIVLEAYSPFGSGKLFNNEVVAAMAERYQRSAAQIALRWSLDHGFVPLPRSSSAENIENNLKVDFELAQEDRKILDTLDGIAEYHNPDERDF
ncbi:aldo/keto reductase [Tuanshanicoccus lijuaniae]|uniref:aldo/keto reductase n=1 Tax=Aerococcaceae bacterium zg-1292 TaxID=2774330 RepID=UPI0019354271|nr:aldo/keto reductase [Aerococcaceae bacterium zg-1292]MBF6625267.1 aldo/keto reductase [Aerococcaceae bacterium zg-BR9]MBF6978395.1 aldo/keto reductase [Aerococcaceae bacterium zg-BR22]MBS4456212.1 aldo/keto reductase [Aerococcaceae bacterium zg-A91]MBS4458063.1 aldo/keto reductase [Aerococcaceae bacterium zg-BR33]